MKLITKYEVEGCWSHPDHVRKCRACGTIKELVPKEGHYNSQYWKLQRDDGALLYCCPEGCRVKAADKLTNQFIANRFWLTSDSKSWNMKWDYSKIEFGWILKDGSILPCKFMGHLDVLPSQKKQDESVLFRDGTAIGADKEFVWETKLTKKQKKTIMELVTEWGMVIHDGELEADDGGFVYCKFAQGGEDEGNV